MTRNNFSERTKREARERANHTCEIEGCNEYAFEVDHKEECWEGEDGGDNSLDNAQILCRKHHQEKTSHSTYLRCKGKRFEVQKGRPKSGKIKSRSFEGKGKSKIATRRDPWNKEYKAKLKARA